MSAGLSIRPSILVVKHVYLLTVLPSVYALQIMAATHQAKVEDKHFDTSNIKIRAFDNFNEYSIIKE
jgi:hypothetical protein